MAQANDELHRALFKQREKRLREAGLDFEAFRRRIVLQTHVPAAALCAAGYLDGVANQWSVKQEAVGDTVEWVAMFPPHRTLGSAHYKRGNNFEYLINNRFLVF